MGETKKQSWFKKYQAKILAGINTTLALILLILLIFLLSGYKSKTKVITPTVTTT